LQPNGVQALEYQELLYEFWISTPGVEFPM